MSQTKVMCRYQFCGRILAAMPIRLLPGSRACASVRKCHSISSDPPAGQGQLLSTTTCEIMVAETTQLGDLLETDFKLNK